MATAKDTESCFVGWTKQRKKAALVRGLWELYRHSWCREKTYLGGAVDVGAAGLGAAGLGAAGLAAAPVGAGTPDCVL